MKRIASLIVISAALSFAQGLNETTSQQVNEHRAKVEQAIQDRDYDAWKAEHDAWNPNDTRLQGKVTKDNFETFAQMVEARQKGDRATARALREQLGIAAGGNGYGNGNGKHSGQGAGQGRGTGAGHGKGLGCGSSQAGK